MRVRLTSADPADPQGAGGVWLESPYDAVFVQELKAAIPYHGRQWDSAHKRWGITSLYLDTLMAFLTHWGVEIRDDRSAQDQLAQALIPPMPADLKDAFDSLFLAYTAPLCVAEGAYRALSKYWHPDRSGGHLEDFHRVNDAIETIRTYLDPQAEASYGRQDDIPA
jgi:hypothetical protein